MSIIGEITRWKHEMDVVDFGEHPQALMYVITPEEERALLQEVSEMSFAPALFPELPTTADGMKIAGVTIKVNRESC